MTTSDVVGGSYYNMLALCPLFKDGKYNAPARNMFRDNTLASDAVVQMANGSMSHQGSYQTYAGRGAEVIKVGGYRTTSTAGWGTFKDDISLFSDASAIPKDVADLHPMQWRADEEDAKANFFLQSTENHMLYGTNGPTPDTIIINGTSTTPTATPEKYTGLAARYRTPDNGGSGYGPMNPDPSTAAQKGVWSAGVTSGTNTTSIWFIRWGKRACSLITPENDPQYGLKIEDLGLVTSEKMDSTTHEPSGYRRIWMKEYEWKHGVSIYPGENGGNHVARLRNINNDVNADHTGLKTLIYQILEEFFLGSTDGIFMYIPPRLRTIFDVLYEAKTNLQFTLDNPYKLSPDNWAGKVFIRTCRAININETAVAPV